MKKLIDSIISFSLRHRYFVIFATFLTVIYGVYCYLRTPIEAFPDVTNTRVQIITQWPGRSAEEVERYITIPIESEMNSIPDKTSLRSISLFGLSVVTMIFDDHVEEFTARQTVYQRLAGAQLPEGTDPEIQPPYGPTGEIFRYTLRSSHRSVRELKTIQDWVVERNLKKVPGIADVVSFGGEIKIFEVQTNPTLLNRYGLTMMEVFEALQKSNTNVGADIIEKADQAFVVRGIGNLVNIKDIENLIVTSFKETPVLIKNVAQVKESSLPKLGHVGRDLEDDVVQGIVIMRKHENPSEVLEALKNKIAQLNDMVLPADVKIETFYDRSTLIGYTTNTVKHNLIEGIIFVTVIVFIFMADWRTTLIVSLIIPLALLFAFICLHFMGMSANLLSMGAIDFGIIIDGAVVMVEGVFVVLDHKSHQVGMARYNNLLKFGLIRKTSVNLGKAIFFSKLIIISALLPIFAFQKVEGKMFSPLAYTLAFALLGALIFTLTLVPVLCSMLLNKNVKEKHNFFVEFINRIVTKGLLISFKNSKLSVITSFLILIVSLFTFKFLGTEFLPQLNEGALYIRASMPISSTLSQSVEFGEKTRNILLSFQEVNAVLSQAGRPNDGTDPTGFFNIELHVDLKPKDEWERKISKEQLLNEMRAKLEQFQGINFNFSQPIMDNVEEAVSGVKGSMALKIYGRDINEIEDIGYKCLEYLKKIPGISEPGVIVLTGQPEIRVELNEERMAHYGVVSKDCNDILEMAIGGKTATKIFVGERKFDVRLRYDENYRKDIEDIGSILVPTLHNTKIPIREIATIHKESGPAFVYRENNERFCAVKFSVRDRDLGSTISEAQQVIEQNIKLKKGNTIEWKGEFENQVRAQKSLAQMVPVCLVIIFLLLFVMFNNVLDPTLVLLNVPFALIGGIWALWLTGTNFSIAAGVGFIALFGVCVQNGVILVSVFKENMSRKMPVDEAVRKGVIARIRPVVMTAMMASIGLLPAALSTGIGSETQKPLAIVVIGGLISATILTLLVFPIIVKYIYTRKFAYKFY
ncbi:MAG: CusA/CzcA family heavy metal efflux RND transporter [Cytophagales bacterium]